jgi:hypothetical protein
LSPKHKPLLASPNRTGKRDYPKQKKKNIVSHREQEKMTSDDMMMLTTIIE